MNRLVIAVSIVSLIEKWSTFFHTFEIPLSLDSCNYTLPFLISSTITKQAILDQQFNIKCNRIKLTK